MCKLLCQREKNCSCKLNRIITATPQLCVHCRSVLPYQLHCQTLPKTKKVWSHQQPLILLPRSSQNYILFLTKSTDPFLSTRQSQEHPIGRVQLGYTADVGILSCNIWIPQILILMSTLYQCWLLCWESVGTSLEQGQGLAGPPEPGLATREMLRKSTLIIR